MKNLYLISFLFIFLISCQKEESPEAEIPEWLEPRIEELENSDHCFSCNLTRYTYNKEFYYSIYCGYWSCVFCEVYNLNGERLQELENFDFDDFISKRNNEIILWSCPESD